MKSLWFLSRSTITSISVLCYIVIRFNRFTLLNRTVLFFVDSDEATSKTSKIVPLSSGKADIPLYIQNDVRIQITFKSQKGWDKLKNLNFIYFHIEKISISDSALTGTTFFCIFKEYLVLLDNINGNTLGINNKKKKIDLPVNQGIWWYEAYGGNCSKGEFQASGAYALRTKGERHRVPDKEMQLKSYILTVRYYRHFDVLAFQNFEFKCILFIYNYYCANILNILGRFGTRGTHDIWRRGFPGDQTVQQ